MSNGDEVSARVSFLRTIEKAIPVLAVILVSTALVLAIAHHFIWQYGVDKDNIPASFFDLDSENTIGSWFASFQWFAISVGAFIAFYLEKLLGLKRKLPGLWIFFALVFIVASVDEATTMHETVGEQLKPLFVGKTDASIWSYFRESPWLVFYSLPLGAFIGFSIWFLSERLRTVPRALYLCAFGFALYIVALVIEFVQGMPAPKLLPIAMAFNTTCSEFYAASVLIEETLENLGSTALFIALLYYNYDLLAHHLPKVEQLSSSALTHDK